MVAPQIVEREPEQEQEPEQADQEPEQEPEQDDTVTVEPSDDVQEATVDLSEDDFGGGLFSGVEGEKENSDGDSASSETETETETEAAEEVADGLSGNSESLEAAINEGVARMGVIGLTDGDFEDSSMDRESLQTELSETFAAFRLGYFGSECINKYVLEPADGDVSPVWGLAGSMLMAAGMIVWMRPDGDEKLAQIREKITNISGGAL